MTTKLAEGLGDAEGAEVIALLVVKMLEPGADVAGRGRPKW